MDRRTAIEWMEQIKHRICGGDEVFDRQRKESIDMAITDMKICEANNAGWISADNRPPCQGRYLVYGLTIFIPDHIDQPNAYWEVKIAYWSNWFGWNCKVKYWMQLPEPPKEE